MTHHNLHLIYNKLLNISHFILTLLGLFTREPETSEWQEPREARRNFFELTRYTDDNEVESLGTLQTRCASEVKLLGYKKIN